MWEYLIKPRRPVKPKESADIHPVHNPKDIAAEHKVKMHEERVQGKTKFSKINAHEQRNLICPACHSHMHKEYIGKIVVDKCPDCQGVFLDKGELELISKRSLSSYTPSSGATNSNSKDHTDFLIYTPHGLSNHVMEHD